MNRLVALISMAILLLVSPALIAEEYAGAEIVKIARGEVTFKHMGKTERLPLALSLKVLNEKGEQQDIINGVRYLLPGNIVNIKTGSDRKPTSSSKTKTKSKTPESSDKQILEIKFVSGKVGELPKAGKDADLKLDPNWKGMVYGGDGYNPDPYWVKYIPTAKVGDFVEYIRGDEKDGEPGRIETVEVGKDYVVIHKVWYIFGKRQDQREKHRLQRPGEGKALGVKPPKTETDEVTIAGKKVLCQVEKKGGQIVEWKSFEVPFDGLVKKGGNAPYVLTDFGRGK